MQQNPSSSGSSFLSQAFAYITGDLGEGEINYTLTHFWILYFFWRPNSKEHADKSTEIYPELCCCILFGCFSWTSSHCLEAWSDKPQPAVYKDRNNKCSWFYGVHSAASLCSMSFCHMGCVDSSFNNFLWLQLKLLRPLPFCHII